MIQPAASHSHDSSCPDSQSSCPPTASTVGKRSSTCSTHASPEPPVSPQPNSFTLAKSNLPDAALSESGYTESHASSRTSSGSRVRSAAATAASTYAATHHLVANVCTTHGQATRYKATANVVGTHVGTGDRIWTIGGWWDTRLHRDGDRDVIRAITLHPSWQTGDISIMSAE